MNNELQSALSPQHQSIDYEGEHSRHSIRDVNGKRTLIHNAPFIFTCDEYDKVQVLQNHSIIIDGDTITAVLPASTVNLDNFDIVYDAGKRGGTVLMPGFINTHAHSHMYLMRSAMMLDEGESIDETIAAMAVWQQYETEEALIFAAIGDITEQQKSGITVTLSHGPSFDAIETGTVMTGHTTINAVSAVSNSRPSYTPEMVERLFSNHAHYVSIPAVSLHYLYKTPTEALKKISNLVERHDALVTFHMAESVYVAEETVKKHGIRETALLEKYGLLNEHSLASHVLHLTTEEIHTLAKSHVGIAHLPTSNIIHKSGTFKFWDFEEAGAFPRISLGTDSVVSKNRLDLLTEAYQTRISHLYERTVKFSSLFKMLTSNGARVLRMSDRGRIAPGFKADINFWKLKDRGCIPYDQNEPMTLLGNIITHGGRTVRGLMINGRFIIKNRRHQLVDESKLLGLLQTSHMEMRKRVAGK